MIRINLPYVWLLAETMDAVSRIDDNKDNEKIDLVMILLGPQGSLEQVLYQSVFSETFRSSRPLAERLLEKFKKHTAGGFEEGLVPRHELWAIKQSYAEFRTAFLAEMGTFPTCFVSQKGSHDTLSLLDQPALMFPADLKDKVPEAMFDVAEAGKALCYELATACGFHLFRATEAVLRRYYSYVTDGAAPPKMRNISVYVQAMRQRGVGDEKILSVVEQLSKLHRNPLIHPEVTLTVDEALSIHGISRSAISAMTAVLPVIPPTTTMQAAAPNETQLRKAERQKSKPRQKA